MKKLLFTIFALLISLAAFNQSITVTPESGMGDKYSNAIPVPLETEIIVAQNNIGYVYFFFYAPVNAKYYIQRVETSYDSRNFILYDNQKERKQIEKKSKIQKDLKKGSYVFQINTNSPDKKFSFIITLHTSHAMATPGSYDKWTVQERKAMFAKAKTVALSETIEIDNKKKKQENCFRFTVTEAAPYQISVQNPVDSIHDAPCFQLINDKCRALTYHETNSMIELISGTYYLITNSRDLPENNKYSFIIAKEGEVGWDYKPPSWLKKFERESPMLYLIFLAGMGILISLILFFAAFRPYNNYLRENYDTSFFGAPFIIMLVVFLTVICLENFTKIEIGVLHYSIVIACDVLTTLWMCISHYLKTRKIFVIFLDVILSQIAYCIAVVLMFAALIIAIVIIIAIVVMLFIMLIGSVGFGSSHVCPNCGKTKTSGGRCPNCGY